MNRLVRTFTQCLVIVMIVSAGPLAVAQATDGGNRAARGNRRGRGDPAQWQKRMLERYKETLAAGDEKWAVIEPLLKAVMEKQQAMRAGRGRFSAADDSTPVEIKELQEILKKENATEDEINSKLEAYRKLREKQQEELKKARKALQKVLTARQVAQMVLAGVLE